VLTLFRRNLLINYFWLLLFAAGCLSYYLIFPSKLTLTPLSLPFEEVFNYKLPFAHNIYIQLIYIYLLVCIQSVMASSIVVKNRMSRALSIVPAGIMCLFCFWCIHKAEQSQILAANVFFILSVQNLFKLYKAYKPITTTFNAGFFLGISCLFYNVYIVFLLVLVLGLISLRGLKVKELLQLIIAFVSPFFLLAVALHHYGQLDALQSVTDFRIHLPGIEFQSVITTMKVVAILLVILILLLLQQHLLKKKKFDAIKKIELNYWFMLFGFLSLFVATNTDLSHMIIISLPVSILAGLYLEEKQNKVTKEFAFLLLVIIYFAFLYEFI